MLKPQISASEMRTAVAMFYDTSRVPLFVGRPGMSKTAQVRAAAADLTTKFGSEVHVVELHLASMSEVDVRGYLIPQGDQAIFTKPVFWQMVEKYERGILFLDEFMQAPHELQKAVAPLILDGCIGEFRLPPGWRVVLAGNGINDNAGSNSLLSHILNRVFRLEVTPPDPDMWALWAIHSQLAPECIAFAKLRPMVVFDSEIPADGDTPWCTPRSLHAVSDLSKAFPGGLAAMAKSPTGLALMTGAIGPGAAAELVSVVNISVNLPTIEEIVANPETARVPEELSEAYAATMLVAVRADVAKHGDAPIRYLLRFQPNIALTGIVSLVNRDHNFAATGALVDWVQTNRDLLKKFQKYITIRGA